MNSFRATFISLIILLLFNHINAQSSFDVILNNIYNLKNNFDEINNIYLEKIDTLIRECSDNINSRKKLLKTQIEQIDSFSISDINSIDSLKISVLLNRYKANLKSLEIFSYSRDCIDTALDSLDSIKSPNNRKDSATTIVYDINNETYKTVKKIIPSIKKTLENKLNRSVNLIYLYKDFLDIKSQFESLLNYPTKAVALWGYERNAYGIGYYIDVSCISKKIERSKYIIGMQTYYIDNSNSSKFGGAFSFGILINNIVFMPSIIFPRLEPGISVLYWKEEFSFGINYSSIKRLGISLTCGFN
ncbi:MAG: hypothetical protein PVH88_26350 [Ignavibacteria bacterium]|jgi:hypothetical protein